jgi:hypothetical protein
LRVVQLPGARWQRLWARRGLGVRQVTVLVRQGHAVVRAGAAAPELPPVALPPTLPTVPPVRARPRCRQRPRHRPRRLPQAGCRSRPPTRGRPSRAESPVIEAVHALASAVSANNETGDLDTADRMSPLRGPHASSEPDCRWRSVANLLGQLFIPAGGVSVFNPGTKCCPERTVLAQAGLRSARLPRRRSPSGAP